MLSDDKQESPDFLLRNKLTNEIAGLEITRYYPHRYNRRAVVRIQDRAGEEGKNKYQLFEKDELGYFRFVPPADKEDFQKHCLFRKELLLEQYKNNHPECSEFWLLIVLDFYDNVMYESIGAIETCFQRVFVLDPPGDVNELVVVQHNQ